MKHEEIDSEQFMELLGIYMELAEKQDAAIYYMSRVIKNQDEVIRNLRECGEFPDCSSPLAEEERRGAVEALKDYENLKYEEAGEM